MSQDNIDQFNDVVSTTFALLYEEFPVPTDLAMDHYIAEESWAADDETFVNGTLQWLEAEGYIRAGGFGSPLLVLNVVLTHKGLMALRAVPDVIESREPLGSRMSSAVKDGAKGLARKLAEEAISFGVKYASNQVL